MDLHLALTRLEASVETAVRLHEQRLSRAEQDIASARDSARKAHERLDTELERLRAGWAEQLGELARALQELHVWRARVIGYAAGIAAAAGLLSGLVVALVVYALG